MIFFNDRSYLGGSRSGHVDGVTVPRCNTITVMSSKENSCQEAPRLLSLSSDEYTLSADKGAAGVTRSHSHGSVPYTQPYLRSSAKDIHKQLMRPASLSMSDPMSCLYYDAGCKQSYHDRQKGESHCQNTPKHSKSKQSESRSNWELNCSKDYKCDQNKQYKIKKWVCSKCTLENPETRTSCEVCLFPHTSTEQYPKHESRAITTLSRYESIRRRNGTLPVPSSRGVVISVPDWPKQEKVDVTLKNSSSSNATDTRPTYQRSLSEQADTIKSNHLPSGKVISSRRSLHECFDLTSSSYSNSDIIKSSNLNYHSSNIDRPNSYSNFSNRHSIITNDAPVKLIHDKNLDANADKDDYWDECEGVIYALPNKGKYKDLHLQLQVSDSGVNYSYVAASDDVRLNNDTGKNPVNCSTSSEFSHVDNLVPTGEHLSDNIAVSEVTAVADSSNIRTSHIGTRFVARDVNESSKLVRGNDNTVSVDPDCLSK